MSVTARKASYRQWARVAFAAAIVSALLATWLWDLQWAITAGVFLFAALVFGVAAIP